MRRLGIGALVVVAFLAVAGIALRKPIALRLMQNVIARNMQTDQLRELPDGLHVALCGAGSPLADPSRQRGGPCVAVIAGDSIWVVDAGSGASRTLSRMRLPQGAIAGVLLTHFHSDHIDGLGELLMQRWVNGTHASPTPVHGPQGVEQIVEGLNLAYRQDEAYRVAHHGAAIVPPGGAGGAAQPFDLPAEGVSRVVVDAGGLKITAFAVDHAPVEPAVGYRFDYAGRSVVVSGDTDKSGNLQKFAEGVDLLVHEALAAQLVSVMQEGAQEAGRANLVKILSDIPDYHATPVEAAETAQAASAGHLLFYHVVPPLPLAPLEGIFLEGVADAYAGPVTLGRDGTLVSLEPGTDAITVGELF